LDKLRKKLIGVLTELQKKKEKNSVIGSIYENGNTYFLASHLAKEFEYAPNHITRLARQGKVISVYKHNKWYIDRNSLKEYRELIQKKSGNTYFLASHLAKEFEYAPNHITRLARQGKVISVYKHNKWYIDRNSLKEYRKRAQKNRIIGGLKTALSSHRHPKKVDKTALLHSAKTS